MKSAREIRKICSKSMRIFGPERYEYLDKQDSILYDRVKDSDDPKDIDIRRLLEDKSSASRFSHLNAIN